MTVARGEFLIQSFSPAYLFTAEFGDGAPLPDPSSYDGWSVTSIPKRMGLTEWAGRNPMVMPVDFLIDRLEEGDTLYVQQMRDTLDKIAATHSRDSEPPICIFDSGGLAPHDYTHAQHVRWVISGLAWDNALTINSAESRRPLRVGGTLTLTQYNHDDVVDVYEGPADRNRARQDLRNPDNRGSVKGKGHSQHTVKPGETLSGIAARELGDSTRAQEIAKLNKIRNSRTDLKTGMVLKLPKS